VTETTNEQTADILEAIEELERKIDQMNQLIITMSNSHVQMIERLRERVATLEQRP
jgi:beta-phosphoglucomutase-like phosphatase (HAD superfamily)